MAPYNKEEKPRLTLTYSLAFTNRCLTGGNTAAEEAHLVQISAGVDFRGRDFRDDGVLGEGGAPHKVVDGLPVL